MLRLLAIALTTAPAAGSVRIEGVPHVRQLPDYCGEACVTMWARKLGRDLDQKEVFAAAGKPKLKRGLYTPELRTALITLGFTPGPVWFHVPAADAGELERLWEALHADLQRGVPSIVCMHYDDRPDTTEHFRLILGYDANSDQVIFHEPAEDAGAYRRMDRDMFLQLWPLKYNADRWTVIRLRLAEGGRAPSRDHKNGE